MPRRVLFLPWVLVGCAPEVPCPTFAETTVGDPDEDPAVIETMRAALDEFASWTTREGVCVDRIVAARGLDTAGRYGGDVIKVNPLTSRSLERTVSHELCHAWDYVSDHPSLARPDLFLPDTIEELDLYPTEEERIGEAFARACAEGPREAAFAQLDAELCDEPYTFDPAQAWLREHVYDAFVADLDARVDRVPMTITRTPLWTEASYLELIMDVATAGDAIAVLLFRFDDADTYEVRVRLVDPVTATVTAELPLPVELEDANVGLLSTDGAPILWVGSPLRAWRLDPEDGSATLLPVPSRREERMYGHVYGDTAWMLPYSFGESSDRVLGTPFTVDLATGAQDALPMRDDTPVERIVGNGDRVSVQVDGRVDTWSFENATWSTTATAEFRARYYAPLSDGRLTTVHDGVGVPAVLDAEGRTWSFPDEACGESDVGSYTPHVTVGDDLYVVTHGDGDTVDLVRVQF
ncbi:MAG: hypothetical protein V4850_05280 [Myxococcota bacterium]